MSKSRIIQPEKTLSELSLESPWAFYSGHEGGVDGTGTGTILSNDPRATSLPDLSMGTALGTQWSAKNGWYTTNGTSNYARVLWAGNEAALDSVYTIGYGAVLIWGMVSTLAITGRMISVGAASAGKIDGFEIENNSAGKLRAYVGDGTNRTSSSSVNAVNDGGDYVFALLIDHRAGGTEQVLIYENSLGAGMQVAAAGSIAGYGDIGNTIADTFRNVQLGAQTSSRGSHSSFWAGSSRRHGCINFGQNMPSNINQIITELGESKGMPVRSMEGV